MEHIHIKLGDGHIWARRMDMEQTTEWAISQDFQLETTQVCESPTRLEHTLRRKWLMTVKWEEMSQILQVVEGCQGLQAEPDKTRGGYKVWKFRVPHHFER